MDSNAHYRPINPNLNKKQSMAKFWSQKHNILSEGMPSKMNYQKRYVKYMVDLLNDETHKVRRKKNLDEILKQDLQKVTSSRVEKNLSEKVQIMLKKIGKNVNYIKKSIIDITKMNGLFLEEQAKRTFFKTHQLNNKNNDLINKNNSAVDLRGMKTIKKLTFRKTQSDLNMKGNKSLNNITQPEKTEKKDDYTKNFVYVNDNYHRQLNFAFLKYNSDQHLENIKFLVQVDPSIRDDINNIVNEVQNDIVWKCDKKHFAKKYLNLKERYKRARSLKQLNEKEKEKSKEKERDSNTNNNVLPNIRKNNIKNRTNTKSFKQKKSYASIFNKINYGSKYNKKELNKLNAQKEQTKEEMNHMLIASKEIDHFIQDENISNKIDMFKTDYARQMYGYYPSNDSKSNENLLEKDYFSEDKDNIVKKIGNVFSFKMDKTTNEQEKMYKGKIYDEAKKFRKRIIDGKKNALDEFNGYITTYQIKLPKDKNETRDGLNTNQSAE